MSNNMIQSEKEDTAGKTGESVGVVAANGSLNGKANMYGDGLDGMAGVSSQTIQGGQVKYAKIQPAIAIKPKPSVPNTTFNPNSGVSSLKTSISLNINTSKNWVLPPRPRPGRKPTYTAEEARLQKEASHTMPESKNRKTGTKKKIKSSGSRKDSSAGISAVVSPDTGYPSTYLEMERSVSPGEQLPSSGAMSANSVTSPPPQNTDEKRELERKSKIGMRYIYLNKLREQDLIRNYIDIINNQIKELKFVQNGLITFDALNSEQTESSSVEHASNEKKLFAQEQLENINNINDLNKSITYCMKSSNSIQNVTKKFTNSESDMEKEIEYYSKLRAKCKLKSDEQKKPNKLKQPGKLTLTNNIGIGTNGRYPKSATKLTQNGASEGKDESFGIPDKSYFTLPSMNPISSPYVNESDDDFYGVLKTVTQEQDASSNSNSNSSENSGEKFILNDMDLFNVDPSNTIPQIPMNSMIDNLFSSKASYQGKKKSKLEKNRKSSCGFCANGTPCMCLDAEVEFNNLTKTQ